MSSAQLCLFFLLGMRALSRENRSHHQENIVLLPDFVLFFSRFFSTSGGNTDAVDIFYLKTVPGLRLVCIHGNDAGFKMVPVSLNMQTRYALHSSMYPQGDPVLRAKHCSPPLSPS